MPFPDIIDAPGRACTIAFWLPLLENIYSQWYKKEATLKELYSSYFSSMFSLRPNKKSCLAFCVGARGCLIELEELERQQAWHCRHLEHLLSDPAPLRPHEDFKHLRSSEPCDGALVIYVAKKALLLARTQGVQVEPAQVLSCVHSAAAAPTPVAGSCSSSTGREVSAAAAFGSDVLPRIAPSASRQPLSPSGLANQKGPVHRQDTSDMKIPLLLAR